MMCSSCIKKLEMTVEHLRLMFQLCPSNVWLSIDNRAIFPDTNGEFNMEGVVPYTPLDVMGIPIEEQQQQRRTRSLSTVASSVQWSEFSSMVGGAPPTRSGSTSYTLKVIQVIVNGFERGTLVKCLYPLQNPLSMFHMSSQLCGNVVATADGLLVEDSSGTNGMHG